MINLLPPAEKNKLFSHLFKKQISLFGWLCVVVLAGSAIFIINTLVFLEIQTRSLRQQLSKEGVDTETQQAQTLESDVKRLNNLLNRYQEFQGERISVVGVFAELQKIAPQGIKLDALSFDEATGKIIISGKARSRDDVLAIENGLKKSYLFERLESPLNNFLEKENANFSFVFYVK